LAQCIADGEDGLLDREWLFDEVKGAEFCGADGCFDVAMTGDDHDRGV
jgi:hypothetical protein